MTTGRLPAVTPVPVATLTVRLARYRHPAVGRNRLYDAMRSGDLHAVKVGRRIAIAIDALDAWVAAGCPVTEAEK